MIWKLVQYQVKPEALDVVVPAIEAFVAAIRAKEPRSRYEAFRREDGVSFVHLMVFHDNAAEAAHQSAPYTQKFVEVLYPNCEKPPVFTDLDMVGADQDSQS